MKKLILLISIIFIPLSLSAQQSLINRDDSNFKFFLESELGTVKVNYHTILIGSETAGTGTTFDFVTQGGQEILFPIQRFNAGIVIADQHRLSFLYQPLEVLTEVTFKDDVTVDNVTFPGGTPMELSYGFPFYRITYAYDFFKSDRIDLAAGAAIQLRDASIVFKQQDGEQMTVSQNLGPVPALNLYGRYQFANGFYALADITGIYASSAFINGANFDFSGSLLDASLRGGYTLKNNIDLFMNLRFLGGSADGVSEYPDLYWTDSVEDATANYLATTSLTLGLTLR